MDQGTMTMENEAGPSRQAEGEQTYVTYQKLLIQNWCRDLELILLDLPAGDFQHEFQKRKPPEKESHRKKIMERELQNTTMDEDVANAIQDWMGKPGSAFLWIEAPETAAHMSKTCLIAYRISQAIPGSVMCSIPSKWSEYGLPLREYQNRHLVYMLYNLIADIVCLLPDTFMTNINFKETEFKNLNSLLIKPEDALGVLETLLVVLAREKIAYVAVIDGIQNIEAPQTMKHLENLVQMLREYQAKMNVKVLFVTDGTSDVLKGTLTQSGEWFDASNKIVAGSDFSEANVVSLDTVLSNFPKTM